MGVSLSYFFAASHKFFDWNGSVERSRECREEDYRVGAEIHLCDAGVIRLKIFITFPATLV